MIMLINMLEAIFKPNLKHILNAIQGTRNLRVTNQHSLKIGLTSLRELEDRKEMLRSKPHKDEGTAGETGFYIDSNISDPDTYPTSNIKSKLFNGVLFFRLPIVNIKVSPNNTIMTITDSKGVAKIIDSCGIEGFKNARKGTNIAAQTTAVSIGTKAIENGIKTVRVRVRGLGPGRFSAIKGLQLSGLEIVSITDSTPVSWHPPRPKKQRKL